jgi:hypothetical protein
MINWDDMLTFFCLAQFKSIISTCFVMFDIIDLTTRLGVIYIYCRRFGPARTVNRPVNLLLRAPAQMG